MRGNWALLPMKGTLEISKPAKHNSSFHLNGSQFVCVSFEFQSPWYLLPHYRYPIKVYASL